MHGKKEEGLVTIFSECGFVKTLLNWYNNEQHISYLSEVRVLLGPISGFGLVFIFYRTDWSGVGSLPSNLMNVGSPPSEFDYTLSSL